MACRPVGRFKKRLDAGPTVSAVVNLLLAGLIPSSCNLTKLKKEKTQGARGTNMTFLASSCSYFRVEVADGPRHGALSESGLDGVRFESHRWTLHDFLFWSVCAWLA